MNFGEKLAFLRKQHGMTQMELAEKLDISRQAVSKWERGTAEPSIENLIGIGKLFDVSVDDLVNDNLHSQDVPTEQAAVKEQKNESCHELKEDQVASVSQEPKKRRFSLLHVFAAVSCVLAVCVIVLVRLLTERDQYELDDQGIPIIPIEDLNQEYIELPEEATIVITYERP